MKLQILVQEYVNLLIIYQDYLSGNKDEKAIDLDFLFQEKNKIYGRFIDTVLNSDINELIIFRDFLDKKISEISKNIDNLLKERNIIHKLINSGNAHKDDLLPLFSVVNSLINQRDKYNNINIAVNNIITEKRKDIYTKKYK